MEVAMAPDLVFAGALIYKEKNGELVPTWRYRVEPFQRAVAEAGVQWAELERACGFKDGRGSYVQRLLGLRAWPTGGGKKNGKRYPPRTVTSLSYANAVKIATALDLDFVQWEL